MGNNLGKKRQTIEEKYTRPQGLYENPDIDIKMLRKLVLKSKLAPCYPGEEDGSNDREECPICFLYYPSLNRSKCCSKGICTECYVQMKPSRRAGPTRCPFCKELDYSAEYMGVRSKEERHLEQIEEQKVIEARIRMQQEERLDEERLKRERLERGEFPGCSNSEQMDGTVSRIILEPSRDRAKDSNADLEDLMLEEAIWASIHDNGYRAGPSPFSGPSSSAWRRRPGEYDDVMVTPGGETGHLALGGVEDSFEEQMMMALAISLAESRSRRAESDAMAR